MHNSCVAWFRCTPGTQKRFLAGIDRQAAEFRGVEVESWAGRAGNGMAWDGTRCRVWQRWLHSCIRAPQRNLVSSQGSVVCIEVEVEVVVRAHLFSLHACTGELRLLGP